MFLKITERCCWRFQNDDVETSSPGSMSLRATTDMMQPKRGCSNSLKKKIERFWWEPWILLPLTGRLRSSLQSHDKPCDQESLCTETSASCQGGCPGPPTWKSTTSSKSFFKSPTCPGSTGSRTTPHRPISPPSCCGPCWSGCHWTGTGDLPPQQGLWKIQIAF